MPAASIREVVSNSSGGLSGNLSVTTGTGTAVEDTLVGSMRFASGAIGTLHATTAAYPGYPRRVEITGTEGTLRIEHDRIAGWDLKSGAIEGTTLTSATTRAPASRADSALRSRSGLLPDCEITTNSASRKCCGTA